MKRVRLGVIGCGVIGRVHLRGAAANPDAEVVAVADLREEAARAAATEFGVETVYAQAEQLIADDRVEAVVLAMPTGVRTRPALRALDNGKHVLLEKPAAMNAGEVKAIMAARGDRVVACCSARMRFLESAEVAARFIAAGHLGELRSVHCRAFVPAKERPAAVPPAWRLRRDLNGGGILVNWGSYDLDYLLGITGWRLRPREVMAQAWPVSPAFADYIAEGSDAETHFCALIRCDGGIVLSFERGEYMPARAEEAWQIVGAGGTLQLQMTPRGDSQIAFDEAVPGEGVRTRVLWQGGNETWAPAHAGVVNDFVGAIRERRPPRTGLEQALVIQEIIDAIYASAAAGRAVRID